jgi:hypothetical protein
MRKLHSGMTAISLLAVSVAAFAVGTQAPAPLTHAGGPRPTYNGYTNQEIDTAVEHANKAAASPDITGVQENLRHVVNCLVGPMGAGFDPSMDDPCKRMGNGALNDVQADSDEHRLLTQAFNEAKNGLAQHDLDAARDLAKKALNDLENAANDVKQ